MLEAIQYIRRAILQRLDGEVVVDGVAAPVYGRECQTTPHFHISAFIAYPITR
jgi:hypothetical protein